MDEYKKCYADLTDAEIKIFAKKILDSSFSEREVQQRLTNELGYKGLPISITRTLLDPSRKNIAYGDFGSMAMMMMSGHNGTLII